MNNRIVCIDFDLTVADYKGWRGEGYAVIDSGPLPGAKDAIKKLRNSGTMVLIHSTRCGFEKGMLAIVAWLNKYNIMVDGVCSNKPPADLYIDDKGITFNGNWPSMIAKINNFKHWKEKRKDAPLRGKHKSDNRSRPSKVHDKKTGSVNNSTGVNMPARKCATDREVQAFLGLG